MKRKDILKLINNIVISSYVLNVSPTWAIENNSITAIQSNDNEEIKLNTDNLNVEDNIKNDNDTSIYEQIDEDNYTSSDLNSIIETEKNNETPNGTIENSNVLDNKTTENSNEEKEADISKEDDSLTNSNLNDITINDTNDSKTNTDIKSSSKEAKITIEDNWVNRSVAQQVYYDPNMYTNLTEDDYLKVTYLSPSSNLTGDFACEDLLKLTNLTTLSIYSDKLTGNIPDFIGELTSLQNLAISGENLTGTIPESIGNLTNLTSLSLGGGKLTGEIPESIGNLTNLMSLTLSNNKLTGSIPESIGSLNNLRYLYLQDNDLSGSIPDSIGNLKTLNFLNLSRNNLSGSIPETIGNLNNLQNLYLDENKLTGDIPTSIGNLSELTYLSIHSNNLTGSIPESIGNLGNLQTLNLFKNQLSGSIPNSIGNLSNLEGLYLYTNQLTGVIPESISKLTRLDSLSLYENKITGEIPAALDNLPNLRNVYLYDNQLVGEVPSRILNAGSPYNFSKNFLTNAVQQAQLTFDNLDEIVIDVNNSVNIEDIKAKLKVVKDSISQSLSDNYELEFYSDDESILDNNLNSHDLGVVNLKAKIKDADSSNIYAITNNTISVKVSDLSAPKLSIKPSTTEWTNDKINIIGEAYDNYNLEKIVLPDNSEVKSGSFNFEITQNGVYTFIAYDSSNNKIVKTITVNNIDTDKPVLSINTELNENNTVDIIINAKDYLSGISNITVNGEAIKDIKNPTININKNGEYIISVTDIAGNTITETIKISNISESINEDKTDSNTNNSNSSTIPNTGGISNIILYTSIALVVYGLYLKQGKYE